MGTLLFNIVFGIHVGPELALGDRGSKPSIAAFVC